MLLASFLANDAAASFDERRLPPAAQRGQVPERAAQGAEQEVLAGSPAGEPQRSRSRQKFLRADPGLDAVERRWSLTRLRAIISVAIRVAERADGGSGMRAPLAPYESSLSQDPNSGRSGRDESSRHGRTRRRRVSLGPGVTSPKSRPCRVKSRPRRHRVVPECPPGPPIGRREAAGGRRRW